MGPASGGSAYAHSAGTDANRPYVEIVYTVGSAVPFIEPLPMNTVRHSGRFM